MTTTTTESQRRGSANRVLLGGWMLVLVAVQVTQVLAFFVQVSGSMTRFVSVYSRRICLCTVLTYVDIERVEVARTAFDHRPMSSRRVWSGPQTTRRSSWILVEASALLPAPHSQYITADSQIIDASWKKFDVFESSEQPSDPIFQALDAHRSCLYRRVLFGFLLEMEG